MEIDGKKCKACDKYKPLYDFYKGHSKCKACVLSRPRRLRFQKCISCKLEYKQSEYPYYAEGRHSSYCKACVGQRLLCTRCGRLATQLNTRGKGRCDRCAKKLTKEEKNRLYYRDGKRCLYCDRVKDISEYRHKLMSVCASCEKRRHRCENTSPLGNIVCIENRRAEKLGLPCDLTMKEAKFMLAYFNNSCAICRRKFGGSLNLRVMALDHWIPISSFNCVGTTATNIIPLCHGVDGCNNKKSNKEPSEWVVKFLGKDKGMEKLQEIETYFEVVRANMI